MQINEQYWGALGVSAHSSWYGVEYTTTDLYTGFNDELIPLNEEIDVSVSPWAINTKADVLGLQYPFIYRPSLASVETEADFKDVLDLEADENTGSPFYFAIPKYSGNFGANFHWFGRNAYNQATLVGSGAEMRDSMYVVRKFDYSRFAYIVYVVLQYVGHNDWSPNWIQLCDFIEYYSTYSDQNTYWISGLAFVPVYAQNEAYPNLRQPIEMIANTLSNFKSVSEYIPSANLSYSNDFLDNFMTIAPYTGTSGWNVTIGMTTYYSSVTIQGDTWAQNISDSYLLNFDQSKTNVRIAHVSSNYSDGESWWKVRTQNVSSWYARYSTELDITEKTQDEVIDYILKQAAYMGTWFCASYSDGTTTAPGSSPNWYLGEINQQGITTGHYERGSNTEQLDNYGWKNPWDSSGYSGRQADPNKYSDETGWNTFFSGTAGFCKAYLLNSIKVDQLHAKFYDSITTIPAGYTTSDYIEGVYLTNNPTDVIMSLRFYNVDLYDALVVDPSDPVVENVFLGSYDTQMSAVRVGAQTKRFEYGSCFYYPHFNDFRDYEPYSYAELIIPYCGTVKISPSDYMGHKISIQMGVDFATGSCTAYIFRDDLMLESISGQMGIDIPVSAIASSDLQRDINSAENALKQARNSANAGLFSSAMQIAGGAISGNPLQVASAFGNMIFGNERAQTAIEAAEFNLEHTPIHFKQAGAAAPALNALQEQNARLIVYRPRMKPEYNPEQYGKTVGFATLYNGSLESFTGFTQCSILDTSGIECTAAEKNQIIKALQAGVYL